MSTDRPKALLYADAVADGEGRILAALPEILDALIARAREGDIKAATYLLDRVLGRAASLKVPPGDDRRLPFTEADADEDRALSRLFRATGAD
jgi:hypothetical protein